MKELSYYNDRNLKSRSDVFHHFIDTLTSNNRTWDYFINWEKVFSNCSKYNIEINILNSLCDTQNFDEDLTNLLLKYPEVIQVFPTLIGVREDRINVLNKEELPEFNFHDFDFRKKNLSNEDIKKFLVFSSVLNGIKIFLILLSKDEARKTVSM